MIKRRTYVREVITRSLIYLFIGGLASLNGRSAIAQGGLDAESIQLRFAQPGTYLEAQGGGTFTSATTSTSIQGADIKCGEVVSVFVSTPSLSLDSADTNGSDPLVAREAELHFVL